MKKPSALIAIAAGLACSGFAQRVTIDGNPVKFDVKPQTIDGYMFVPIRGVFDKMGIGIDWVQSTGMITAMKGTDKIQMQVGSRNAMLNDKRITADVAPYVYNGRTMVPLRLVAEATGADVSYVHGAIRVTTARTQKMARR